MALYAVTIFLSAFLLFQVQPLIAKMILPWFGGTAAVWTTCMLFFQLLLLCGYVYSHAYVSQRIPARRQVHIALLVLAAATLPLAAGAAWKPAGGEDPTGRILGLLATSVGLPYFVLSTTGPLVQAWHARSHPGAMPYRLFALSNLGSMLALLSYPLLVEPALALGRQAAIWSGGFVLFALLCAALAWRSRAGDAPASTEAAEKPGLGAQALWAALAACASTLLLAFTGHMSLNIAAIPFLWVVPLALYLLSFVLCFEASGWYRRWLFLPLVFAGFVAVCVTLTRSNPSIWTLIPLYSATLFAACMVCHGELARSKPHPRYLTGFYLMLAFGGALGGVLVGFVAPNAFRDLYELPLGMVAACIFVGLALLNDRTSLFHGRWGTAARIVFLVAIVALGVQLSRTYRENAADLRVMVRNFYGVLNVRDSGEGPDAMRVLSHGTIIHGKQFLEDTKRDLPTTYYGVTSGVGLAILDARGRGPVRLGVVGLGAGTLAAYGRSGDLVRFYDINPQVVALARTEFSFLKDSPAKIEVALGDARLSLEREEAPQNFDVLALDAFSSDAIPVHLLTVEAFRTYLRHLKPGGILAVHISNRYLDLAPVVQQAARALSLELREIDNDDDDDAGAYRSDWMLLSASPAAFRGPLLDEARAVDSDPSVRPWTDDYSDLYHILK